MYICEYIETYLLSGGKQLLDILVPRFMSGVCETKMSKWLSVPPKHISMDLYWYIMFVKRLIPPLLFPARSSFFDLGNTGLRASIYWPPLYAIGGGRLYRVLLVHMCTCYLFCLTVIKKCKIPVRSSRDRHNASRSGPSWYSAWCHRGESILLADTTQLYFFSRS